jgi:hypothetical protein
MAPASTLAAAYAAPSNRSPRNAMKNCPGATFRESVVNDPISRLALPRRRRPPLASATSAAVNTSGRVAPVTSTRP